MNAGRKVKNRNRSMHSLRAILKRSEWRNPHFGKVGKVKFLTNMPSNLSPPLMLLEEYLLIGDDSAGHFGGFQNSADFSAVRLDLYLES